jgi:hypothetical protein
VTGIGRYETPESFRTALDDRIRRAAVDRPGGVTRFRQLLIFDRFLARVFEEMGTAAVAKGGVVLELRLARARTTRDVDLRVTGSPAPVLEILRRAGVLDLGDGLSFLLVPDPDHPAMEGEGLLYGGERFRTQADLAGKPYGLPFGVDVAFGDVLTQEPETVVGSHFFEFVGVPPAHLRVYPRESHVAEKLHAYTLPRARENSRVKDLPDLALLALTGPFEAANLDAAIERTFQFRKTHAPPPRLPDPPSRWEQPYARMAADDALPWPTLDRLVVAARSFLDPVLARRSGRWDPTAWRWVKA